jgi:ABC-type transport system involved in multi-copper enzyme maturation permease subunit
VGLEPLGRLLVALGIGIAVVGGLLILLARMGVSGIPGSLVFRGERVTVFVPIGLSILVSIILTVVLNFIFRR